MLNELSNFFPLPDSNSGGGYGNSSGGMSGERKTGNIWPYIEITDLEAASEDDDSVDDERDAIRNKDVDWIPSDHLGYRNQKAHAFVKGNTRGLTGIMASVEPEGVLEALAGAIGQASPSYNVTGADGTTRTRPGRTTGSKRGWFQPHPPKPSDPEIHRYSLKDIALADEEAEPVKLADIIKNKIQRKNTRKTQREGRNALLRAYIRSVSECLR